MNRRPVTERHVPASRSGAVMVEAAVVLGVFLTVLMASLDLSLAVLVDNSLGDAARRLSRAGIVRGSGGAFTAWGPTPFEGTADEQTEIAQTIQNHLVIVDPAEVQIAVQWPDGGNEEGDRIEVTLSTDYPALLSTFMGGAPYRLQATSVMRIEP